MKEPTACIDYVDLNNILANTTETLLDSNYTSAQQRNHAAVSDEQPKELFPLVGGKCLNMPKELLFQLIYNLELACI
ncbi:hypothetical protein ACJJIL_06495 [Microbulbifer sp. EKSA005]|uniref:hypothetical protein n=1 Tax=Microbulbifer sp. EKSA005 TaxID=3243364 RepID=UPI00404142F4